MQAYSAKPETKLKHENTFLSGRATQLAPLISGTAAQNFDIMTNLLRK
jgi:hypothetical protein